MEVKVNVILMNWNIVVNEHFPGIIYNSDKYINRDHACSIRRVIQSILAMRCTVYRTMRKSLYRSHPLVSKINSNKVTKDVNSCVGCDCQCHSGGTTYRRILHLRQRKNGNPFWRGVMKNAPLLGFLYYLYPCRQLSTAANSLQADIMGMLVTC